MSQSPDVDDVSGNQLRRYQLAWTAVSRMIAQGRSFSGHERNCCFLNLSGRGFANVSAATDLDYPDDSRAIAVTDWNFDGRLDFWMTNRTAPRLRFLRNDTRNDCQFVAVRLQGVTCNRDAIGAKVALYLKNEPQRAFVQQVTAGDGYLAQSTKWVHFGVPPGLAVDRVVVHWPGADPQTFRGLETNRHYQLVQGSPGVKPWAAPPAAANPGTTGQLTSPPDEPFSRTVVIREIPVPDVAYQDWHDQRVSLSQHRGGPVLVNLWSATCAACLSELSHWTNDADQLGEHGLEIVALSVDSLLAADIREDGSRRVIDDLGFAWPSGSASPELVQTLELMHETILLARQDLPLPASFLLDDQGRLAVIYKGRVPTDRLLKDLTLLGADPATRRAAAVPYQGRWATKPPSADLERIVRDLDKLGRTADAIQYARQCIADEIASSFEDSTRLDLHGVLGELLLKQGQRAEAADVFAQMLRLGNHAPALHRGIGEAYMGENLLSEALEHLRAAVPTEQNDPDFLYNLGIAELAAKKPGQAIVYLRRARQLRPDDTEVAFQLANALHSIGQTEEALELYRQVLRRRPQWPFAANNLAWILATHPDASLRDGPEAVRLAEAVCQAHNQADPTSLATLAAAYAEVGRFDDAVRTNERAAELAISRDQGALAKRLRQRTETLRASRPIRQPAGR